MYHYYVVRGHFPPIEVHKRKKAPFNTIPPKRIIVALAGASISEIIFSTDNQFLDDTDDVSAEPTASAEPFNINI